MSKSVCKLGPVKTLRLTETNVIEEKKEVEQVYQ